MKNGITTRLMGAEVEYYCSSRDKSFSYVNEYYSGMREVNSILLPCSDVLETLMTLKGILEKVDASIHHKLGTKGWVNSYGMAYNGVHLHLSGSINKEVLEKNIFRLMNKYGLSPRTVTSWHIFSRPSTYGLKRKRKHQPIYKTPRGTLEIRVLDVEYFLDVKIIKDLAIAIEAAYNGELIDGSDKWVSKLLQIPLEDYKASLKFLDKNLSPSWIRNEEGIYTNTNGNYHFDYTVLSEWAREEPVAVRGESFGESTITLREGAFRGLSSLDTSSWIMNEEEEEEETFDEL